MSSNIIYTKTQKSYLSNNDVKTKIIYTKNNKKNIENNDYIPVINSNTVIEYKTFKDLLSPEYLKYKNYLSEFASEEELERVKINLNIQSTKYLTNPLNHPYILKGNLINVQQALDNLYEHIEIPIDISKVPYTKEGQQITNVKEALDDLYNGSGSTNNPIDHPYTNENSNVTNVKEALDELYIKGVEEINAELVKYEFEGKSFKNIKEALDSMFYVNININSFSVYPNETEIGDVIPKVTFKWSYNKSNITLKLDGILIDSNIRSTFVENITNNISKTLWVSDGTTSRTSTASVYFKLGRYYGTATSIPTSIDIINRFTRNLNLNKNQTFTVNAGVGEYIYLMVPQNMNNLEFWVGGMEGGFNIIDPHFKFERYGKSFDNILYVSSKTNLGNTKILIK